ncbi:hypothetical protein TNCV_2602651 [Trichonephila clavipes]|nr:hypothetical protein TNCV_2602651 [Trichonephila clavipes]
MSFYMPHKRMTCACLRFSCPENQSIPAKIEEILASHCSPTRGLWAMAFVILSHSQVTKTTPELASLQLTTTPAGALNRFFVYLFPTRQVFSSIGLELTTRQPRIRCLGHHATRPPSQDRNRNLRLRRWACYLYAPDPTQ